MRVAFSPIEQGTFYDAEQKTEKRFSIFRPPDFCLGSKEDTTWTIDQWQDDQELEMYYKMTEHWAEIKKLFQNDPWGKEGPDGPKGKMTFMATYNLDAFRSFIFESSFMKRFKIKKDLALKIAHHDEKLLLFGMEWVKFFLWGIESKTFRRK